MANRLLSWTERELRGLIVRACRALSARGLVAATDGNVSARLGPGRVLVTPSGMAKGEVDELSIVLCDMEGRKIRGRPGARVSSEVHMHLAAYRERDDVHAVVHAHPPVASAFTFAGRSALLAEPIIPELVAQVGLVFTVPYVTPGTRALAEAAAPFFLESDVLLLAQHGAITLGPDPWQAYLRMEKLEHAALILKHARELAGSDAGVRRLDAAQVEDLIRRYGAEHVKKRLEREKSKRPDSEYATIVERVTREVMRRLDGED